MEEIKNIKINGSQNRPMLLDIFFEETPAKKPVVIYAHGFNGFKDWGNFDLVAHQFAAAGFIFIKFNFSHNGTTVQNPENFADLEAFGRNNYSIELEDLNQVINWVCDPLNLYNNQMATENISLIGHSMGGGIAILHTATDKRINKLITWAGITECKTPWGNWSPEKMQEWKNTGVQYYENSRTKQQMPLYYQLYEDYIKNEQRLNIKQAIQSITIPVLVCHGTMDTAVPIEKALDLKRWQPNLSLFTLETDHVFGRKHPWLQDHLPVPMQQAVSASILFLQSASHTPFV
ncbi:MAG: alpha/beta fold hydrolase [Ferruginibacter sp.]